ncbi:hypothetical protein H8356DRAFT_1624091 [Neocallimastix lanati (nom. inval.)]|uniref:DNA/RNA-binding protein Alba-like domain-containing protein n=1 Tax=Neocallimastix californiae TaxID=1754190 RepID=A0A1Y2E5Q6_9FUNG|nr:hypothetical protein H8356DRAFT_1624091 [Neocallimastix sp. JGI-2020a]ORY66893.1 hypothetical protein LY90DRAFT_667825 [Neocallimastix californiae]|eukprot:ORY66893.1 hypothetical protein LY90DRAFT_667825 [Neocallimastix californiae]
MENYRRTEVETEFDPSEMDINILNKKDYELYITTKGKIKNYVTYGLNYLMDQSKVDPLVITGKGNAINKAVTVAEIIKRKVIEDHKRNDLIQENDIEIVKSKDTWTPIEDKLDKIVVTKNLPGIIIKLYFPREETQETSQ